MLHLSAEKPRARGFSLVHQKVTLDVDLATGLLSGLTELTLTPTTLDLRVIYLHFRQGRIKSVAISAPHLEEAGVRLADKAAYSHNDPVAGVVLSSPKDAHTYPEAKRRAYGAFAESEEGELAVHVEDGMVERQRREGQTEAERRMEARAEYEYEAERQGLMIMTDPAASKRDDKVVIEYKPLTLKIEFEVAAGGEGLAMLGVGKGVEDWHAPHIYTSPTSPDAARCWVPCVDNLWERCTWELDFVVPRRWVEDATDSTSSKRRKGKGRARAQAGDEGLPVTVAASGELVEHVSHPSASTKSIFRFVQSIPTTVQHITFAVGPFEVYSIPVTAVAAADADDASVPQPAVDPSQTAAINVFSLPGSAPKVPISTGFLRKAMDYLTAEFGSYPFSSFNLVFVDEPLVTAQNGAGMSIFDTDLLHSKEVIDQAYETRHMLAHALVYQWVGVNIIPKTWSDTWLINGLSLYIAALFLRRLLGNNEHRFRLKSDADKCARMDDGSQLPICVPGSLRPPDATTLPFVNLKSALVLHILDRRLGKTGTSLGLSRVIPKVFLSAITGELPGNALSTQAFFRTCRKVSGVDMRSFAEQWVWGSGCPRMQVTAYFNKKKMLIEMTVKQHLPAKDRWADDKTAEWYYKPTQGFEGQMTVRIHEADGTPYEHVLDIREGFKTYDVPFNAKYKRVRRNTKRYLARKAAAAAAAAGDVDAREAMDMLDLGFDLAIWEDEDEREKWKVADWTEEEEEAMVGAPYEWIRLDADFEWIAKIDFDQSSFYFVNQLQRDRDVVAQIEAIHVLRDRPPSVVISILAKTVLVTNYFFRVRMEAAQALQFTYKESVDHLSLFLLLKIYQTSWCYPSGMDDMDPFKFRCIPRPKDFSDFADYFVRKAVLIAISRCNDLKGLTSWPVVRRLLVDALRYNDNSTNPYSDGSYLATVIACLGYSLVLTTSAELQGQSVSTSDDERRFNDEILVQSVEELDRYMEMDRLVPSYQNVVTIAGLECRIKLTLAGLVPLDIRRFLSYTREGNYIPVRLAAFDCLLLGYSPTGKAELATYYFTVAARDSSRLVRRHVARGLCEALVFLLSTGQIRIPPEKAEQLVDGTGPVAGQPHKPKDDETDSHVRALRKEIGRSAVMREGVMTVVTSPEVDFDVRWAMIQLAEMLVKPTEESPPKLVLHIPVTTPTVDTTPALPTPKIKLFSGASTPTVQTPSISSVFPKAPLKLVLPSRQPTEELIMEAPPKPSIKVKKKEKKLSKAEKGGMSAMDLVACRSIIHKMEDHKTASHFLRPVDPVKDKATDYFTFVKTPMDLSTVRAKLEDGQYTDRQQVADDIRLIPANAQLYNQTGSPIYITSEKFLHYFNKQWEILNNILNQHKQQPAPAPASEAPASAKPAIVLKRAPSISMPPPPLPASATASPAIAAPPRPTIKLKPMGPPSALATPSVSPAPPPPPPKPQSDAQANGNGAPKEKKISLKPSKIKLPKPAPGALLDDLLDEELGLMGTPPPQSAPAGKIKLKPLVSTSAPKPASNGSPVPAPTSAPPTLTLKKLKLKPVQSMPSNGDRPASAPVAPAAPAKITPPVQSTRPSPAPAPSFAPPAPTPAAPPLPQAVDLSQPMQKPEPPIAHVNVSRVETPLNPRRARLVIDHLKKFPAAFIFARPVDPIADGCPTYYDEIKSPMDFGTILGKIDKGQYRSWGQFGADVELVFRNCRQFNPPSTTEIAGPWEWATEMETSFKTKEWPKAISLNIMSEEKKELGSLLNKLMKWPGSEWFRDPVDVVALDIPDYPTIVTNPRSLSTIKANLANNPRYSPELFERDMLLIADNARRYNGPDSAVGQAASALERQWRVFEAGDGGKKRKDDGTGGAGATKKQKH